MNPISNFNKDGCTDIAYYGKYGDGGGCWRVYLNDKNRKFTVTSFGDNVVQGLNYCF